MPSFDAVSKLEWSEVLNAHNQAEREVGQRFDFRGTNSKIERNDKSFVVRADSEERARAALGVLEEKLIRRKVSLKHLDVGDPMPGQMGAAKIPVGFKEGIDRDNARKIVKIIKDSKLKVQAAIQEDTVRITGKKRDDLQAAMQHLRDAELEIELQFVNFRD